MKKPHSALALLALACAPSTLLLSGCREGGEDSAAIDEMDDLEALADQLDEQGEVEVEVRLRGPERLDPEHISKLLQGQPEGSWELLDEDVKGPRLRLLHPDVLEALAADPAVASIRPWGRGIRSISSTSTEAWAPPSDDTTAPSGSVIVNSGADYSASASVRLTLAATDDVAVTQMCISNAATCTSWTTYATSKTWSLGSTQGSRTVRVFFRDAAGNVSEAATDTIFLDSVKPTNGSASASGSDGTLALSWTGFADAGSGIASYKVVSKTGTTAPSSCATGTVLYSGSDTSATVTGLTNGTTYAIRICATDAAGNSSTGALTSGRPAPEYDPPTDGSVLINSDATYTNKAAVTLTLSATDPSGVGGLCVSNSSTCSSWATYATSKRWSLSSGEGTKTVRVWYRDSYNNATLAAVSDTIIYDVTRPSNGTVTASPSSGQVELSWTGFADGRSGLASYKVVSKVGTVAPTSCSTGTVVYAGTDTAVTHTGLTDGTTYSYRVCAIDNAGNVSTGKTITSRPAPEYNPPTDATVSINSDAAYSASRTVTLTVGGADDSGLGSMCISNSSSCASWTTYATSKRWALASGGGTKTVRVWLRDIYGNPTTSAVSDTIIMDTTKPTNGTASATMHSGTEIDLSWSGFADSQSGLASYKVVYALGSTAPTTCSRGTTGYAGTETSVTIGGLRANSTYSFRICALDAVGNTSTGASARTTTNADGVSPEGSILIDEDALYSTDLELDLSLEATDAAAVSLMCVTTSDSSDDCDAWSAYDTASTFTLDADTEDGEQTLYAWFEDANGNVNSATITDNIFLDTQPPVDGVVEVSQSADTEVVVSWSEFSDLATGVESYRAVMRSDGTTPTDCSDGEVIYSGSDDSVTVSDLSLGGSYAVRVCAWDYTGQSSEGATATFTPTDITAPADHSVLVNGGAASTASASVSLTLSASDAQGVTEMCISSSSVDCDGWVEYSTSATWELGATEGSQDVYAWFRDAAGNTTSTPASDAIIYDITAPTDDELSASGSDATVELSWGAASDAHAGVDHYEVVYALGSTAPATCDEGTSAGSTTDLAATITGLTNGSIYSFRVCAVDEADNRSSGTTTSSRPAPEYDGPTGGTVSINAGAEYAGLDPVTVAVSAEDPSGVADVCISLSSTTCTDWQSYGDSYGIQLPDTSGSHSVYVWFRDIYGNESSSPSSDDILVDPNAPSDGEATDEPSSDASIEVTWSGYSDSESGLAGYTVVYAASDTSPASCDEGTLAYEGTDTSITVDGLTTGQNYSFRICATDAVGNMSEGYTFTTTARDITAPANASVEINDGDSGSASTSVTLSLSATDGQGVSEMCISSTSSCSSWVPYAETYPWTIAATETSQTVYVWFRDAAYNETSSPATDSIFYDITNPTDGSLTGYGYDSAVELNLTAGALPDRLQRGHRGPRQLHRGHGRRDHHRADHLGDRPHQRQLLLLPGLRRGQGRQHVGGPYPHGPPGHRVRVAHQRRRADQRRGHLGRLRRSGCGRHRRRCQWPLHRLPLPGPRQLHGLAGRGQQLQRKLA
jgi:Fibronectin type III domain